MTPVQFDVAVREHHAPPPVRRIEDKAGTFGMWLFIATEAFLFIAMFFAYYYVEKGNERWRVEQPPRLHYALPMLGLLLVSSAILLWGERQAVKQHLWSARAALIVSFILGLGFLALSYFDDAEHLRHITNHTNAYGSVFYTITTLHAGHLILGLLMFLWLLRMPRWEPRNRPPHRPYHSVVLYWLFVTAVWLATVAILYIAPVIYTSS